VKFFLNGYYGYDNAGDEAVLAAILEAISSQRKDATFTVTSGDTRGTETRFREYSIRAVPRQNPKSLIPAIRACDVFISGGGSLLQDVTSLRNIVYYTGLIRLARLSRKPVMIYAQGIGPLLRPLSQKLTRAAVQSARAITVRDEDSRALLQKIGVTKNIEVTADPVWALTPDANIVNTHKGAWNLSLRPWPGYEWDPKISPQIRDGLQKIKGENRLRFVPMQPQSDAPIGEFLRSDNDELIDTRGLHPKTVMAHCGGASVMIAMRLHALIFASAQGVPCVAVNYDPKVEALAKIIGAPLLQNLSEVELQKLPSAIEKAQPFEADKLQQLQSLARRSAEIAVSL
jgi:polysaccharide pyruvyl transferase CsaB